MALVQRWQESRLPFTPEEMAKTLFRLQSAAIREAFGIGDSD
jgi:hypothetical protein